MRNKIKHILIREMTTIFAILITSVICVLLSEGAGNLSDGAHAVKIPLTAQHLDSISSKLDSIGTLVLLIWCYPIYLLTRGVLWIANRFRKP